MRRALCLMLVALSFPFARPAFAAPASRTLIKASGPAVYYFASDGKRYVFPNEKTYFTWFSGFSGVQTISDAELAAIQIGGNVTYRPGIRMLKIQSDPKVYAVAFSGVLRWMASEEVARQLYGQSWSQSVDDLSDAFFVNYKLGDPIEKVGDYSLSQSVGATATLEANLGLAQSEAELQADTWRAAAFAHINLLRQQNGKPPVVMNALLNQIAYIHSQDMAKHALFSHTGTLGDTSDNRIRDGRVPDLATDTLVTVPHPENVDWTGENLGQSSHRPKDDTVEMTVEKIHALFMDEPADVPNHRTTMLSTLHPYTEVGIGIYIDPANDDLWLTEDYVSF